MKKLLFSALSLISSVALLQADLVVVQQIESPGMSGEITMKIKGDKMRVDVQDQMSMIVNTTSNDFTTLLHDQKMVTTMGGAMIQSVMDAAAAQAKDNKKELKATGKTEEIDGHKTEIYTMNSKVGEENVEATFWIAKEFPNGDKFIEVMKAMENSPLGKISKDFAPQQSEMPGIPVKTEAKSASGTITTKLVSVKEESLDDAIFSAPADYQVLQMPSLPAPAQQ